MAKHILHNRADATEQIMLHTVRNERKQSDVEETHSKQWFTIDKMIRSTIHIKWNNRTPYRAYGQEGKPVAMREAKYVKEPRQHNMGTH